MKKLAFLAAITLASSASATSPLPDRLVGSWVTERNCANDTGVIFGKLNSKGVGRYGTLDLDGTWTIDGNRVTIRLTHERDGVRMVRKTPTEVIPFTIIAMSRYDGIGSQAKFKSQDGSIALVKKCPLPDDWR